MTVFYYHYTPDYKVALQASFPGYPDYYTEIDKCTSYPSWCSFNSISNETKPDWHPADCELRPSSEIDETRLAPHRL